MRRVEKLLEKVEKEQAKIGGILQDIQNKLGDLDIEIRHARHGRVRRILRRKARTYVGRKLMFRRHFEILEEQKWNLYDLVINRNHIENFHAMYQHNRVTTRIRQKNSSFIDDQKNSRFKQKVPKI